MAQTWLRIVTYEVAGGEQARRYLEDSLQEVIPLLHREPGFRGGHWGNDPESTVLAAVTNWASRESIEAAADFLRQLRNQRIAGGLKPDRTVNLCLVTTPTEWDAEDWAAITSREASNWLRVFFYMPEDPCDPNVVEYLRSSTGEAIEMLRSRQGFRVGYWGHDPVDGTMAAITYWDSRTAIERAGPELDRLHQDRKEHGVAGAGVLNLELLRTDVRPGAQARGWLSDEN